MENPMTKRSENLAQRPVLELEPLRVFIGRWITEGQTVERPGAPSVRIPASDVYQWAPGGRFVMHPAYGRIGSIEVGGLEGIGYDPDTRQYRTYFFDSDGKTTLQTLSCNEGVWVWEGTHTRCRGTFTDGGRMLTARHERCDDGEHWVPSMTVILRKVD
jgi:hypothetical protein